MPTHYICLPSQRRAKAKPSTQCLIIPRQSEAAEVERGCSRKADHLSEVITGNEVDSDYFESLLGKILSLPVARLVRRGMITRLLDPADLL